MKKISLVLLAIISLFVASTSVKAQDNMMMNPVTWKSTFEKIDDTTYEVLLTATIESGWYIYDDVVHDYGPLPTVLTVTPLTEYVTLEGKPYFKSKVKKYYDDIFEIEIGKVYSPAVIAQKVKVTDINKAAVESMISWQACMESGMCVSPPEEYFKMGFTGDGSVLPKIEEAPVLEEAAPVSEDNGTLWAILIEAFLWGFAMLLTPCVFPMVPMTVSFFLKQNQSAEESGKTGNAKGKLLAAFFGICIVALYTLPIAIIIFVTWLAGGESVTADIFNFIATHWVPNLIFFIIFMVFAASFFGAFEIVLPSKLVNRSDEKSNKGGLMGVFFMALTLVLVSFSCTGPIVGTVLIKSTQGGQVFEPIITMLVFSIAFALPFTVFAFAPSLLKNLPKSGGWLNSVKVVLGFIEVALGFKFLSVADQTYHWGLLDREVYLAIWIVCFTLLGLYLLGKLTFKFDSPVKYISVGRLALAILSFTFVVYMIPGMFGAPLKALSGYMPPMASQDFVIPTTGFAAPAQTNSMDKPAKYSDFLHLPHNLNGYFDYEEAVEAAKKQGKPLFIDFTGHGCVNCRAMEENVWSDPEVLNMLNNDFIIVALYADDKTKVAEEDWVITEDGKTLKQLGRINSHFAAQRFRVNAQPYYAIINPETEEQLAPSRGYNLNVSEFAEFLRTGKNNL